MKKILVPTDFSDYADNAVKYALDIAKTMKATIHLCHAMAMPELSPMAGMVIWPVEDDEKIKENSDVLLQKYVDNISKKNDISMITYSSETGPVQQMVDNLSDKLHIDIVIMGMAGAGKLAHFVLGSNSLEVMKKSKVPVILVPKNAVFTDLQKIAFATDLAESDLNAIQKVAHLFHIFNTDILLTHVSDKKQDKHQTEIDDFINDVICKINYSRIYFRNIDQDDVDKGLSWITKNGHIAMLAMVHKKMHFLKRILKGSHTKNLANQIEIPLLILPENNSPINW